MSTDELIGSTAGKLLFPQELGLVLLEKISLVLNREHVMLDSSTGDRIRPSCVLCDLRANLGQSTPSF